MRVEWTWRVSATLTQISMDGKGCWRDNVFVERLWRSVKYDNVYLHAYETIAAVRTGLTRYFRFFNQGRPHTAHMSRTPDHCYCTKKATTASVPTRSRVTSNAA